MFTFLWSVQSILVLSLQVSGYIEYCGGCRVNRNLELKDFIKYGGAKSFRNVEIACSSGPNACSGTDRVEGLLTIYHDGKEYEQIDLASFKTQQELHQRMLTEGFLLKSDEEVIEVKRKGAEMKARDQLQQTSYDEESRMKREEIVAQYREKIDGFATSPLAVELANLTSRIKELKNQGGQKSSEDLRKLEKRRTELIRNEMVSAQQRAEWKNTHARTSTSMPSGRDEL